MSVVWPASRPGSALRHAAGAVLDGIRVVPERYRMRSTWATALVPTIEIARNEVEGKIFCFGGEFGYELLSWLPYLKFLAEDVGLTIRTCSRPGSGRLYDFSSEHIEVPFTWRPDSNGSLTAAREFRRLFGVSAVFPAPLSRKAPQVLAVAGYLWEHKDIHQRLTATNFRQLELDLVDEAPDFLPVGRPIAVINNKDFDNWASVDPLLREAFDPDALLLLRDSLIAAGYFVVYHRFDEPVPEDRFPLDDVGIFGGDGSLDMRDVYLDADAEAVMRLQLQLYAATELAICPQGGNSFLPIIARTRAMVLSRATMRLIEYQDLSRLYGVRIDVFTSIDAIVDAVRLHGMTRGAPVREALQ